MWQNKFKDGKQIMKKLVNLVKPCSYIRQGLKRLCLSVLCSPKICQILVFLAANGREAKRLHLIRQLDRWMDRQLDRWIDRQVDRWMDRELDRWMDRQLDRWMDKQLDRWMDRQLDRWLDRQMYSWIDI